MTSAQEGDGTGPTAAHSPELDGGISSAVKYDVPIELKEGAEKDRFDSEGAVQMGNEVVSQIIGPMPVSEFLEAFLPPRSDDIPYMPKSSDVFGGITAQRIKKSELTKILVSKSTFDQTGSNKRDTV